jgi:hypothetical protein
MASLSPAPADRSTISAANSLFLFELIVGDFHWSAVQVGALAIMASAAAGIENGPGFKLIRHLAHDDSSVMRLALRFAVGADLSADLRNQLDRMYADIQQPVAQLRPFMTLDSLSPAQRDLMRRQLPGLRRIALAAAELIGRIEPLYRTRIHPNFVTDAATIQQFLARAARGERVEVGADCSVRLPQLRQRRKSPRLSIDTPCLLALPGGDVDARLVDVSREGLGLRCESPVSSGQRVAVAIGGRRLEAVVARVEGDLIGVRLTRPLQLSDPLFKVG